jgi:hypothetical protein
MFRAVQRRLLSTRRKARVVLAETALLIKSKIFNQLAKDVFIRAAKINYSPYF